MYDGIEISSIRAYNEDGEEMMGISVVFTKKYYKQIIDAIDSINECGEQYNDFQDKTGDRLQ